MGSSGLGQERVTAVYRSFEKHMNVCKILKIESPPLSDVYFPNVMPKLSSQEKKAIELAYYNGYYAYPRQITLEGLAKMAKITFLLFKSICGEQN